MSDNSSEAHNANKEGWVRIGVDWDPMGLAMIRQAAAIQGLSIEEFVKLGAEAEAGRVIRTRGGWLEIPAAAEQLGITRKEVVEAISRGRLKAKKIDGDWLIDRESVKELTAGMPVDESEQIELDLRQLVEANGLSGLELGGDAPTSYSASWCYVTQDGRLICPKSAWRKLGREKVIGEALEGVRRFVRRRDSEG